MHPVQLMIYENNFTCGLPSEKRSDRSTECDLHVYVPATNQGLICLIECRVCTTILLRPPLHDLWMLLWPLCLREGCFLWNQVVCLIRDCKWQGQSTHIYIWEIIINYYNCNSQDGAHSPTLQVKEPVAFLIKASQCSKWRSCLS